MNCSCECLEGPSIFLESIIHSRVLIFVCGEGEIVCVMEWLVILPALSEVGRLYLSAFSSLIMSLKTPWIVHVDAWRGQAYS